ncbi:hypothetical protein C4J98_4172 [Pseudomonas orientalis]|nr:hypothetical protein C4J98_4172 [Pseudomonas orientalis]
MQVGTYKTLKAFRLLLPMKIYHDKADLNSLHFTGRHNQGPRMITRLYLITGSLKVNTQEVPERLEVLMDALYFLVMHWSAHRLIGVDCDFTAFFTNRGDLDSPSD